MMSTSEQDSQCAQGGSFSQPMHVKMAKQTTTTPSSRPLNDTENRYGKPLSSTHVASLSPKAAYFAWQGFNAKGGSVRGIHIAYSEEEVRNDLKQQHIIVLRLKQKGWVKARALRATEITLFSRQLASLLDAGIALLPALQVIAASQSRPALASMVRGLARDTAQGLSFSHALAKYPYNFNAMYCQLIALGEASGALAALLRQLADERERFAAQKSKLRAALSYPIGVLVVSFAIIGGLMIGVVPTFEHIFNDFGASLPAATQVVLTLSKAIIYGGFPTIAMLLAGLILLRIVLRHSKQSRDFWQWMCDRLLLKFPILGPLFKALAIARWSRALSLLLHAGTPLADTFDILKGVTNNTVFYHATQEIERRVLRGERLTQAMQATDCFPAAILQPMAIAEECAGLETLLKDLAALNDRQVDERIARLTSLVEPLIMVLLGGLIGGLVIALYLPIIHLGNVI